MNGGLTASMAVFSGELWWNRGAPQEAAFTSRHPSSPGRRRGCFKPPVWSRQKNGCWGQDENVCSAQISLLSHLNPHKVRIKPSPTDSRSTVPPSHLQSPAKCLKACQRAPFIHQQRDTVTEAIWDVIWGPCKFIPTATSQTVWVVWWDKAGK